MQILLGTIYGALIGLLLAIPLDIALASALIDPADPVGLNPNWSDTLRWITLMGAIAVGAILGGLRGHQKSKR